MSGSNFNKLSVVLRNGQRHPLVGFGTYKVGVVPASASAGAAVTRSVREVISDAIAAGYRCFDCASFYGNEKVRTRAVGLPACQRMSNRRKSVPHSLRAASRARSCS